MKNLMRVLSVLIAIAGVIVIIGQFVDIDLNNLDFYMFYIKVYALFIANLLPIISIALCAYCLERNDSNYVIRIIPIYMMVPIVLSLIMVIFETNADWLNDIYSFLSSTFLGVTTLSVIMLIKANNRISTILRYISFGLLGSNVILALISQIKSYMVNTLPNVYGYQNYGGFNFSTVEQTNEFVTKMYNVTAIAQIFVIILLFITNYAFSDHVELETEDIDYEAIKQDAMNAANMQMQNMYNPTIREKAPDRSASEKGLMNVNNQLGQNSNVGTVKEQAREMNVSGSSLDSLITLSSGPVINEKAPQSDDQMQQVNVQEQPSQEVQETPKEEAPTTPPNLDIQEQMKMKVEQQIAAQQAAQQAAELVEQQSQPADQPVEQPEPQAPQTEQTVQQNENVNQ